MTEFYVAFDLLDGHNPSTGATLTSIVLQPYAWRSIGGQGGGRFINNTGTTIRSIYIKTNDPAKYLFRVDANSTGRLFDTVWFKTDGTEAYFMGANVPNQFGTFWNQVPANTQDDIRKCDSGQGCPFSGQAFAEDPAPPSGPGWQEFRRVPEATDERWRALRYATPSDYREIQAYGEQPDGNQILFLSRGQLHLYDHSKKTVENVSEPATTHGETNRITFDGGQFSLWNNDLLQKKVAPK